MHHALFLCSWWEFNEVSNFTKARKSHLQHSQERRGNCRWTGYSMPSNNTLSRLTIMGWQFEGLNCNVCISITAFFSKRTMPLLSFFSIAFNSRNYPCWGYRFTANNLSKLLFHPSELGDASKKKSFIKQSIAQFGQFWGEVPEVLRKFHTRQKLMRSFSYHY